MILTELRPARDPATEPARLAELAKSTHAPVREAVARNPNAPLPELIRLWKEFPAAMLHNGAIVLHWLLEPQAFWKRFQSRVLRDAYCAFMEDYCREARPVWMDWDFISHIVRGGLEHGVACALAQENSVKVRMIPLQEPGFLMTKELLLRFARDPEESVRRALLKIRQLPQEVQVCLASDPSAAIRLELAKSTKVEAALLLLCSDAEEEVRHAAYANARLKEETVLHLLEMEESPQRFDLARHSSLGVASQKKLAESGEPETLAGLLCHTSLDPLLRARLIPVARPGDLLRMLEYRVPTALEWQRHRALWSEEFRVSLASRTKVPPLILEDLAGDESPAVRAALQKRLLDKRRSAPTERNKSLLERLAEV